jgi:hypothetical protein
VTLAPGTRLGPYEVIAPLGAGGMGEVYRARDTKLNRDVAIKVLGGAFSSDAERLARFTREAHTLAALNHPNIASIYGIEEFSGGRALVMEIVEGEDLSAHIARGPIPLVEAFPIARQIADALETAHEQGIVHRDLKPANVKIRTDGTVKVLDFGLAKAIDPGAGGDAMNSPTLTAQGTRAGTIIGTAAYMSPEQARGKPVDKRADIWAFGVVLYEMLTGERAFKGDDISEILAAVLRDSPAVDRLPKDTPVGIRRLLARCLERDPRQRLRDIGEARFILASNPEEIVSAAPSTAATPGVRRGRLGRASALPWLLAVASLSVLGWTLLARRGSSTPPAAPVYVDLTFPEGVEPVSGLTGGVSIAPDGRTFAMIGVRRGVRRLYLRRFDRPEATEVSDSSGVNSSVFSPDSRSVAFIPGAGVVTRLSLDDEQRYAVAPGADLSGGMTWVTAGILYSRGGALWIAPGGGGTPKPLTTLDAARHEVLHADPIALPSGNVVLFTALTTDSGEERVEALRIDSGQRTVVVEHASSPAYARTGHVLFARDGAIFGQPFDPDSLALHGTAVPLVAAGVVGTLRSGGLGFQVSANGTLLFVPADFDTKHLVSIGRDGTVLVVDRTNGRYANPRTAPDGRHLLLETGMRLVEEIDLVRGTRQRLAPAAMGTGFSTWLATSKGVVFRRLNLPYWVDTDGSGKAGPVPGGAIDDYPSSPGPTDDTFLSLRIQPDTSGDIFLMSKTGAFAPKPLVVTPSYDGGPQLSPDKHWLLYQSDMSGQPEIYVRRFPALDRQWQISEGGGWQTRWSTNGREIYYRNGHNMMAVAINTSGAEPAIGKPIALFPDEYDFGQGISIPNYDVTSDGRFIMLSRSPRGGSLRAVLNWTTELQQLVAAGGLR